MNTRRRDEDSAFRQERYMSSEELQRGLLANCVAKRVQTIPDAETRRIVWALQLISQEHGALDAAAAEMLSLWPERFTTKGIQKLGTGPGRIYTADEVKA